MMKIRTALVALGMSLLLALALAVPAHAAGDSGKQAMITSDSKCTVDSTTWRSDTVQMIKAGALVPLTGETDDVSGSVRIKAPKGRCWVSEGSVTPALPGPLDPSSWSRTMLHPDPESSGLITADVAGGLFGPSGTIHVVPSRDAQSLGEVEVDGTVQAAPWDVKVTTGLMGGLPWAPINFQGTVGWIETGAFVEIPAVDTSTLTSHISPTQSVGVYALPTGSSEQVDTIDAGEAVDGSVTAWNGFLAVTRADGSVGYIRQADLAAPTPSPSPDATAAPTDAPASAASEGPTLGDRWAQVKEDSKVKYDAVRAEHEAKKAAKNHDDSLALLQDNPFTRAAARTQLMLAGLLALFALVAAGATLASKSFGFMVRPFVALGGGPVALGLALAAGKAAPDHLFHLETVLGSLVLGLVVAAALAAKVTTFGRGDSISALRATRTTTCFAVGGFVGGVAGLSLSYGSGWTAPISIIASLAIAGVLGGALLRFVPAAVFQAVLVRIAKSLPQAAEAPAANTHAKPVEPATPTPAVVPEMETLR